MTHALTALRPHIIESASVEAPGLLVNAPGLVLPDKMIQVPNQQPYLLLLVQLKSQVKQCQIRMKQLLLLLRYDFLSLMKRELFLSTQGKTSDLFTAVEWVQLRIELSGVEFVFAQIQKAPFFPKIFLPTPRKSFWRVISNWHCNFQWRGTKCILHWLESRKTENRIC